MDMSMKCMIEAVQAVARKLAAQLATLTRKELRLT